MTARHGERGATSDESQDLAPTRLGHVEVHEDWLRVPLGGETHADFHLRWLRHNCDLDRHPATRERVVDSSELPDRLQVSSAAIDDDELRIRWSHDGRTSRYALDWLAAHAYAPNRERVPPPPSDVDAIAIEGRGLSIDEAARRVVERALETGAAILRRDPGNVIPPENETEVIIAALARAGLAVVGTHFGRIEDLRTDNTTNQNTDQLGYTDAAVDLHTDQPFIDRPPAFQLLHSIRRADAGGDNYLVDAFAAGRWFGSFDKRGLELLRRVHVRFHRKQKAFESMVDAPILGEGPRGALVRYSYFTLAPHKLPFDEMDEWYRVYDRFARLVREPRHQYRFSLSPGDFLFYDNHRMLHARTAFSGPRWVRGVYFEPGA